MPFTSLQQICVRRSVWRERQPNQKRWSCLEIVCVCVNVWQRSIEMHQYTWRQCMSSHCIVFALLLVLFCKHGFGLIEFSCNYTRYHYLRVVVSKQIWSFRCLGCCGIFCCLWRLCPWCIILFQWCLHMAAALGKNHWKRISVSV